MADFEDVQDAIVERLRASNIPTVFEVAVPAGAVLPMENGVILPYVLISFGGLSPVAAAKQGIDGTEKDLKWTTVACECVGNSPKDVRKVTKIVRRLLEGHIPDEGWSQLTERLSGDYTVLKPDADMSPIRYATGIVFNGNANAAWSE